MRIALLNVVNNSKPGALNKDICGGMGGHALFGSSFILRLISSVKKKTVKMPILSFACLQAVFKKQGYKVDYIEGSNINEKYDLILIYGSIVDYKYENLVCKEIKRKYATTKIGFCGTFPTVKPELFSTADFVIMGEVESFFLYEFKSIKDLHGIIKTKRTLSLDDLPTPDFDNFPIKDYSYFPAIKEKPFLVLQASKGCPYSCMYYCPYGIIQGQKYRTRSAAKVVEDIITLIKKYYIRGLQFRDPIFGLDKKQTIKFSKLLISKKVKIRFGIETRLDILDKDFLDILFAAGLRNINIGIETTDENVSKLNKRKLVRIEHQEEMIKHCEKLGINVSAFYILGLIGDNKESVKKTIDYAIKLNTNVAQFSISCPFPGTEYYKDLKQKNLIFENDFEKFNSMNLTFKHDTLSEKQLTELREYAFRKYYFRPKYFLKFLKWQIREFLL